MKQSELKAILKDHKLWIQSDDKQGKRADLARADLRDAYLEGAYLEGADLARANLDGANLLGVNLCNAYLEGVYLEGADLGGANLQGADLARANLRGAKFTTNFKKVGWFYGATFSEDQIPWVALNPKYPKWAHTLKWVKAKADAA